ncbi:hypothetical protein QBC38DRAFT_364611 [Podospora fimiseda]|uniref:2EXR domain-containing protein n=1 Tax=Podospora fimiseda TaxID=252190 RepID=A0AAN7H4H8_9PEZI|nr:hypothetical protein QBC38DRAFT_364611 [Podospora fimiseda]
MTREHTASFHQFLLFPGEIQNLVWDEAAALSPAGIQFLNLNSQASSWESEDITLIPSKQSAALNTVHLSLACRAARAAVLRYEKNITNKTYLRGDDKPRMNLTVDLRRDLICFGNGPGEQDARAVVNGSEGSHIVFSVARRLGIKYKKGWELPGHGPFQHDRRCSVGWRKEGLETTGGSDEGFCSWCVARVVERFKMLEEVWIIVDGGDDEVENSEGTEGIQGWNGTSKSLEMRRFEGYDLSYVSTGRCQQGNRSVKEASEVLERIKCNLMDPRFSRGSWARKLQMGILTSCRS